MTLLTKIAELPGKAKAALVAGTVALTLVSGIAGYSYYQGHHAAAVKAQPQIERAQDQAAVSDLIAHGSGQVAQRYDSYIDQTQGAQAALARFNAEAMKAEDADEAIDPERTTRLLAAQRELCNSYPGIVGCESADHAN
jgi:hypothetical protein